MKSHARLVGACLTVILAISSPLTALAQTFTLSSADLKDGFRPEEILDDPDIFGVGDMTLNRVQDFLAAKGSLGTYRTKDTDGVEKSAAQIIWRVATSYKINPRYLMALIQKEQSLVEDPDPTQKQFDWAAGYGVCDSCSMNDPSIQEFKGFASQLEWAAKQHREKYLMQLLGRGTTISGYAPGKTSTIDGIAVTPVNNATAMLYTYTPHIHGNLNLWHIWQRWYSIAYPDGTVVKGKTSNKAYLIRFGQKRPFKSLAVAFSMVDPNKVITVDDSNLTAYPDGRSISFANYALVETKDAKRYLIVGDKKRLIVSKKVFGRLGFNEDEVIDVSASDLEPYVDGPDITLQTAYPTGQVLKDPKGNYWYVEDGVRHAIANRAFLTLYFAGLPAKSVTQKKLDTFTTGEPYRLHDGELVRTKEEASVYVMENGLRRPIPSADVFETLGWKWKNVITLPNSVLKEYPIGQPVELQSPSSVLASTDASDDPTTGPRPVSTSTLSQL